MSVVEAGHAEGVFEVDVCGGGGAEGEQLCLAAGGGDEAVLDQKG